MNGLVFSFTVQEQRTYLLLAYMCRWPTPGLPPADPLQQSWPPTGSTPETAAQQNTSPGSLEQLPLLR